MYTCPLAHLCIPSPIFLSPRPSLRPLTHPDDGCTTVRRWVHEWVHDGGCTTDHRARRGGCGARAMTDDAWDPVAQRVVVGGAGARVHSRWVVSWSQSSVST